MKIKLLTVLLCVFYTKTQAQLQLLDEPSGSGSDNIISIAIHDNDIFYSMFIGNNSGVPGTYVSNGVPGDRKEVLPFSQDRITFNDFTTQDNRRLFGNGNYKAGRNIYAAVQLSGTYRNRVYKFNKSRTLLLPENIFAETNNGVPNIKLVGQGGLVSIDTIQVGYEDRLRIHHFTKEGGINNYTLPRNYYLYASNPVNFFRWKGALYFVVGFFGAYDIVKVNALGVTRVTENKVTYYTAFNGVSPREFLLDDYIYFTGRDGYYTNVTPGPRIKNYPWAICYSNGDLDFGSVDTAIYDGDDGSLGYKAYSGTSGANKILGKAGNNILYYAEGNKTFNVAPSNMLLNIPSSRYYNYTESNDKVYVAVKDGFTENVYVIDSNLNIETLPIPLFPNSTTKAIAVGDLLINKGKIYFIAIYSVDGDLRHTLCAIDESSGVITTELVFPEEVKPKESFFYPYNNGFIFRSKPSTTIKESLYTWNIENRSKILDGLSNKNAKKSGIESTGFKYDGISYNITSNTVVFDEADQLKVQILDTLSTQFKEVIKTFPADTDSNKISKLFYAVNTLKESNSHQSNITITFNDDMFDGVTTNSKDLSVLVFDNDTWSELTPTSFNNNTKEITIDTSFSNEAFLFLKINGTLSLDSLRINNDVKLYPNPADTRVTISSKLSKIKTISFFDVLGREVFQTRETDIDISHLKKGTYIIKINSDSGSISKKFIVK